MTPRATADAILEMPEVDDSYVVSLTVNGRWIYDIGLLGDIRRLAKSYLDLKEKLALLALGGAYDSHQERLKNEPNATESQQSENEKTL